MAQYRIFPKRSFAAAVLQEMLQLDPCRVYRRAQQTRDRECAACVRIRAASFQRFRLQPASQEPRHEGVACTEDIIDFDRKSIAPDAVIEASADRTVKHEATHRAPLSYDRR